MIDTSLSLRVIAILPVLDLISLPLILMSPPITTSVENVETPVTFTPPAPTINPPGPNVKLELSSRDPAVPARTTLPEVKSDTVADAKVASPAVTFIESLKVETPETLKCLANSED